MKPARSMNGITDHVSMAPPVNKISKRFMAISIEIIEIRDIPNAVLSATDNAICRLRINVSSKIEVKSPMTIARLIMANVGHTILLNWKKAIVPKSPIEQPSRHHNVLMDERFQVWRHRQSKSNEPVIIVMLTSLGLDNNLSLIVGLTVFKVYPSSCWCWGSCCEYY